MSLECDTIDTVEQITVSAQCWVHKANDGVRPTEQRKSLIAVEYNCYRTSSMNILGKKKFVRIETAVKVLHRPDRLSNFIQVLFCIMCHRIGEQAHHKIQSSSFPPIAKADSSRLHTTVQLKQ